MGISSSLFNSSDSEKQTLHKRIMPTQEQYDEQQDRWNALAEHLIKDLKERSSYSISTWLQGSYKNGTQIRPARKGDEFDIDLGVYFNWTGEPEDGIFESDELKGIVQNCLKSYKGEGVNKVTSPPKERCSRIIYDGNFHIDVPAYHLDQDRDSRTLATESSGWEKSDPKKLYVWFKDNFDDGIRDKARRQVRYLKCWAGLKFKHGEDKPSSTLLTVLVAEAIPDISTAEMASDDDALVAILTKITERLEDDAEVRNPVDKDEDLAKRLSGRAFSAFLDRLCIFRNVGREALNCDTVIEAADKWSEAFEHFFPLPEESKKSLGYSDCLPVTASIPEIKVRAVSKEGATWTGLNKIGPIPKDCDIYFEIQNASVLPRGAVVEWMVRNEGADAEYNNDLGHKVSSTGSTTEERSAYKGTHYMDCTVKQYGQIIGFRRIPVAIIGDFKKRPIYKKPYYKFKGRLK